MATHPSATDVASSPRSHDNGVLPGGSMEPDWYRASFDGLVLGVLFLAPLFMGGRHPLGRLVYVSLVGAMAMVWLLNGIRSGVIRYRVCGLELVMILATVFVALQVVPLPSDVLSRLSPRLSHYLMLWNGQANADLFGSWQFLSLTPHESRTGLVVWCAHAVLLLLLIQRLDTRRDARQLVCRVALAGVWLAAIGMMQYLFSNGKFLWVYENPYRNSRDLVRGPFYNENHFAHLLVLTLIPLWVWLRWRRNGAATRPFEVVIGTSNRSRRELVTFFLHIALPGVIFATLLTGSRGGVVAMIVATIVAGIGVIRRDGFDRRHFLRGGIVLAILVTALLIHGMNNVGREMSSLATSSIDRLDERAARRSIWQTARQVIGQFTLCGAGVGSFRETFPLFYSRPRSVGYSYAESGFLQVAVETGLLGSSLLIAAVVWIVRRLWRFWRSSPDEEDWEWALAAVGGVTVSLIHSMFDFVWYIPACMAVSICLLATFIRWTQFRSWSSTYEITTSRFVSGTACIVTGVILFAAINTLLPAARAHSSWNRYLVESTRDQTTGNVVSEMPDIESQLKRRQYLLRTVDQDPAHARAHLRLAKVNLVLFEIHQRQSENPMSLAQIRDAALASKFETQGSQDAWLKVAVGRNRALLDEALDHVLCALDCSPLEGIGYVYLSELAFLQVPANATHDQLVRQALRVRPYNPTVLFTAGRDAIFEGDIRRAILLWRRAYHQDEEVRRTITTQLAPRLPARMFIDQFRLEADDLLELITFYDELQRPSQAASVGRIMIDRLTANQLAESDDAAYWRKAYSIAARFDDPRAVNVGKQAVKLDPDDYTMRRRLAFELLAHRQWKAAYRHLGWCAERNRADRQVVAKFAWLRASVAP